MIKPEELNTSISQLKQSSENLNIIDETPKTVDKDVKVIKIDLDKK